MRKKTVTLTALLLAGLVIMPGFILSGTGKDQPAMGCGKVRDGLDDRLDGDNVAHLYFHQVDQEFDGKNDGDAWAKMSYTFCGIPSRFVFNGHGLEREMPYALIAALRIPDGMMMPQSVPTLLGEAMSNGGGNVHIKGSLPEQDLSVWDLFLVRADMWEDRILAGDEPLVWTAACDPGAVCDQGLLFAELSGQAHVPPVTTAGSGNAVFYENGAGDQLAFILQASLMGTVLGARVHYGAVDTNGPPAAVLFSGSDGSGNFLTAGMVLESDLRGDFAGSPLNVLIQAMDSGMIYVNVQTQAWPEGELRGKVERIDMGGFCGNGYPGDCGYDDCSSECVGECLEECLGDYPGFSPEACRALCGEKCGDPGKEKGCQPSVSPGDPYYERFEGIGIDNSCESDGDCMVGGCSGEVCASEPAYTTCEVLPYRPGGGCLCVEGICRWSRCTR